MSKTIIVEYGTGNPLSVLNMLNKIGVNASISNDPAEIISASKLILPGVGAFDPGMKKLTESGLLPIISEIVLIKKRPILGICLGMQLMCKRSDEGDLPGLGWIDAEVIKFNSDDNRNFRVPHMGWNLIENKKNSNLFNLSDRGNKYYFVHSYYVRCNDSTDILTETNYGGMFVSSFQKDNIFGVQFHPEKSHKFGLQLLKNFVEKCN